MRPYGLEISCSNCKHRPAVSASPRSEKRNQVLFKKKKITKGRASEKSPIFGNPRTPVRKQSKHSLFTENVNFQEHLPLREQLSATKPNLFHLDINQSCFQTPVPKKEKVNLRTPIKNPFHFPETALTKVKVNLNQSPVSFSPENKDNA